MGRKKQKKATYLIFRQDPAIKETCKSLEEKENKDKEEGKRGESGQGVHTEFLLYVRLPHCFIHVISSVLLSPCHNRKLNPRKLSHFPSHTN